MKGLKFYLEYPTIKDKRAATRKNVGNHSGNCIAIIENTYRVCNGSIVEDAIGAVFFTRNSAVGLTAVSDEYKIQNCKRISEKQAREIHPALFEYLDSE